MKSQELRSLLELTRSEFVKNIIYIKQTEEFYIYSAELGIYVKDKYFFEIQRQVLLFILDLMDDGISMRLLTPMKILKPMIYELLEQYHPENIMNIDDFRLPRNQTVVKNGVLIYDLLNGQAPPTLVPHSPEFRTNVRIERNFDVSLLDQDTPSWQKYFADSNPQM